MRGSRTGRVAVLAGAAAVVAVVATWTAPVGAAKVPNACKLLKASEIEAEYGAPVSPPEPGLKTAATAQCTFDVAAGAALPDGAVTTSVMFVGAKAAYNGMKATEGVVPVAGLAKAIYQTSTGALMVLDGNLLVTVQGVFIATGPIRQVDTLDHLIPLAEIAAKRA